MFYVWKNMRLNKYTLVIPNNAQTILYNCITKMLLVVDVPYNQITSNFISSLDADAKKLLQERLIISTDTNDDFAEFIKIKNSFNNSTEIGHFLIHIGYRCNMRCSYYYQNKLHNDKSSINVTQVIDFITTVVKENNYKNLDICFIGGEPLLYYKQLLKIATEINKKLCKKPITFSVVTNGLLLCNEQLLQELINAHVYSYQITLDGAKDDHDKMRYTKNHEGTFDTIFQNMKMIQDKYKDINISINCNISISNFNRINQFILFMKKSGIHFPMSFSLVFDVPGNKSYALKARSSAWLNTHICALEHGYTFEPFYRDLYLGCAMTQKNYHIIGADNCLYKCINAVGNEKFLLTPIKDYGQTSYNAKLQPFLDYKVNNKECENCEFYPVCYGGCPYNNLLQGFKCQKELFITAEYAIIKEIVNAQNRETSQVIRR